MNYKVLMEMVWTMKSMNRYGEIIRINLTD